MSGAFELETMEKSSKTNGSKSKHSGSLFAPKLMDEPRRRSLAGASDSKFQT